MIVRRLPSTPNAQKAELMKDVTTTLSQVNAVDSDHNDAGTDGSANDRLPLPGDTVEFSWYSIKLVLSKMLPSCEQAAATAAAAVALTLSAIA